MRYGKGAALVAVLAAQLTLAGQARAQYGAEMVIAQTIIGMGNQPSDLACQQGEPFPAREILPLRIHSRELMKEYWSAVSRGQAPLGSFILDKHTRWISGATMLDKKTLAQVKDPFAMPGNTLVTEPLGFKVAGDGGTALGHWQVRDNTGRPVATYQAQFRNRKGTWAISSLELFDAQAWVDPPQQYCHTPGDVPGFRIKHAREGLAYAETRLTPARQAEAGAQAALDKAQAQAQAEPGNPAKQEAVRRAADKLAQAKNSTQAYQSMVDKHRDDLARVEAEQKALEAQREAGKAALAAKH